ncbi:MAG: porin family protein [Acidobacteriota bacterium]
MYRVILFFIFLTFSSTVLAQDYTPKGEVFGSIGGGKAYDDEGGIGSGLDFGGGVGYRITPKLQIEGAINTIRHERNFGSGVVFKGTGTFVSANLLYHFSTKQVQPYVIGGAGFVNHQNRSRFPEDPFTPEVSSSGGAFNFGAGLRVFLNKHISIRPEFRVFVGYPDSSRLRSVEAPFSVLRGSVSVSYHW